MKKEEFIRALQDIKYKINQGDASVNILDKLLIRTNIPSVSKRKSEHNDGNNLVCFYLGMHEVRSLFRQCLPSDQIIGDMLSKYCPDSIKISIKGGKEDYYFPIESITYLYVVYK